MIAPLAALAVVAQAAALGTPSTTTLTLTPAESAYGDTVTATAATSTVGGSPQGDIVFSVDGLQIKANLTGGGTATVLLPVAQVGQHDVSASFVPQFPNAQQSSSSPVQPWVVTQAPTNLDVSVVGRGLRIRTSVKVRATGDFGTRPTGRVKVKVLRNGSRQRIRVVERLAGELAVADLGRLAKGRYRAVVTYVGDSQHLRRRQVQRFRVGQR